MNTCQAVNEATRCTLHAGHKGTHYDSLKDESFAESEDVCLACFETLGECSCENEESSFGDEVDHVWGWVER